MILLNADLFFEAEWVKILPPLLTIIYAFAFRKVIPALVIGILSGTFLIHGFSYKSITTFPDTYLLNTLIDGEHMAVIMFTLMIGGMVSVLRKNGSMKGLANWFGLLAKSAQTAQFAMWSFGVLVFFDDYANTLIVGNTMQSISDKFKVSREKLAYIVDSTAAPVASIAFISTWVGTQLGYFNTGIDQLGMETTSIAFFADSLSFAFYPVLALVFMLMLLGMNRDFGPMLKVERLARQGIITEGNHKQADSKVKESSGWLAMAPILTLIIITFIGLLVTGKQNGADRSLEGWDYIASLFNAADSYKSLIWGSFSGLVLALVITAYKKMEVIKPMLAGFGELLEALLILVLAWTFSGVLTDLGTGDYIASGMKTGVSVPMLPTLFFLIAAVTSFATGSSWSTMAILYPFAWDVCEQFDLVGTGMQTTIYAIGSVVLTGSVFGDHCSPVSDTTVMSSMASGCDHISHVRTQLPYAFVVAIVSLLLMLGPVNWGFHWSINYGIGIAIMWGVIRVLGKKV